jgi:phage tail sheath protein FI
MAELKFGSAGVTAKEIDQSGPVEQEPVGIPAGIIGTSVKGPAFVPVTVGTLSDWYAKFGATDGKKFGPLAVTEWMRNAGAVTYLRVLGAGDGRRRLLDGNTAGSVTSAGFVVGEQQPDHDNDGTLSANPYANAGSNSVLGRTYFLGCFMSESAGSWIFSDAGLQGQGSVTPGITSSLPIIRGIMMAPSGVILRLSSSFEGVNSAPASTLVATNTLASGSTIGSVTLLNGGIAKQEFVVLLNGHKGTDPLYPNVITASFDMTAPNYFGNVLNKDPLKIQQAGHYLYSQWDIHPSTAVVTGTGLVSLLSGASASTSAKSGTEACAFLTTSSLSRNTGDTTVPNFENFEDRFRHAASPWIMSQKFGGNRVNLFRLHALDAGANISNLYKISIENIVLSSDPADQFGSFDLVLREFNDRDSDQKPLEQWRGLNLNPSSDRYIAKVIGDTNTYFDFDRSEASQKLVVDGQYPNRSNYVRVEVSTEVDQETVDPTALPMGFRGVYHLMTSGSQPMTTMSGSQLISSLFLKRTVQAPVPMRKDITAGTGAKKTINPLLYWGVQFEHVSSLSTPNASTAFNKSLYGFAKYLPDFMTAVQPVVVGDNEGTPDTAENGIIDADRFNRNMFALDNIQVVTGSDTIADPSQWDDAIYVRNGNITANDTAKTRAVTTSDFTQANRSYLKYSFFMQGGFDGVNLFDRDEAELNNNSVTEDMNATNRSRNEGPNVRSYAKALDIMKNTTNVDIQLLAIPGIRHPVITNAAIDAVEERFDAMFLMDIEQLDNNSDLVTLDSQVPSTKLTVADFRNRALDTSFAAAYFPDVVLEDPNTKTNLVVPPSVVVLGALALNDTVGHPWFAPAGFTRGALASTLEARVKLSKTNMDELYDADVNPLVAFPGNATSGTNPKGGVVVWGQKTLQAAASALDRVNVRRLLIDIRRQVRDIARTIVFEPNRESTLAKFSAAVTPRLQRVQALAGLERFKVIIDSSTTTQADIEANTIRGKIFVQPTKTVEYVSLDFVVSNNVT